MTRTELHPVLGISWEKMPRHIAVIMDGNGRWAQQQNLPRLEGHSRGSTSVRSTVTECARLKIECLTLYSFSVENWKRPADEVQGLLELFRQYLIDERPTIKENNIRVRHLGFEYGLPDWLLKELRETVRLSQENTGMILNLALNYSGRAEIAYAVRKIVKDAQQGKLTYESVSEDMVNSYMGTAGQPDPDLLIRTAGERRISNFLLWQISYAELYVTDVFWPDFSRQILHDAILDFSKRNRRFGDVKNK
jgi:undecaprenyl diphosphate synthase